MDFSVNEHDKTELAPVFLSDDWLSQSWELESEGVLQQSEVLSYIRAGGHLIVERAC